MAIIYDTLFGQIKNGLFDRLKTQILTFAIYGIDHILTPPLTQNEWGGSSTSLGYDKRYDLNVGQHVGDPLRWGSITDGVEAFQLARSKGITILENNVLHQMSGAANKTYYEKNSKGVLDSTLFPKMPTCFVGKVKKDNVFDSDGDQAYGDELVYWNSTPTGYMINGAIQCTRFRWNVFGLGGMRIDMAKNMAALTTKSLVTAGTLKDGFNFAEVYTGNPDELQSFVTQTGCAVYDFQQYFAYRDVSGGANLRRLVYSGFNSRDPSNSILYVESNDSDGPNGVINNKLWFYLHALTIPCKGTCIFAKDYEIYNLGKYINQICWVSKTFAFGNLVYEYVDDGFLVWSRNGDGGVFGWSGGLLCGISNDPINYQSRWVNTPFSAGTIIHDYLGNGDDLTVNQDGWVYLTIGPNVNGTAQNGVAYASVGVNRALPIIPLKSYVYADPLDFSSITVKYS